MYSSKRKKKTASQAVDDGQQPINERSVFQSLRWEKQRQSDREKKEQLEREARLKFEQQLEIERQARAAEDIRREREQREYNEHVLKAQLEREQFNARPENQFIAERKKQTQGGGVILDDQEYRLRVMEERQRQTQIFSQQPSTQYILGESKARKYKKYNEKRKAKRASKKEPVPKVKSTRQVSSTRSAAQKVGWARDKQPDMDRIAACSDAITVPKLDLVPKAHVRVQPETLYASLTEEEKYYILLRRGQIKEQVMTGQQHGVSISGNTPKQDKMVRFLYES
ncbi:hypothetical protein MKX03_021529 [Papaver bracteatum]|nr:hypothetical protein MKX03_021529 [Papaver bracteatum]